MVSGQQHAPAALYPWERSGTRFTGGWVGPRAVWTGEKSRPHRDSIPNRPARSHSLYRLSYLAHSRGSRKLSFPDFMTTAHRMVIRLSALRTGRFLPPGNTPGTHFCYRLSRPQGHSAIGRIISMKNSNDTIWNRTSDLPICSAAS